MRIYPAKHDIVAAENMMIEGIPLAYINPEIEDYEYDIKISSNFNRSYAEAKIQPYQQFDDLDQYFFDDNQTKLDESALLRKIGTKYFYLPQDMIEFIPDSFTFQAIIKKELQYYTDRFYNLRISCATLQDSLARKLLSIFGDAPKRGLSPSNVSVNQQDKTLASLIGTKSYAELDFLFISSADGYRYKDGKTVIDWEEILSHNISVWLAVDQFENLLVKKEKSTSLAPTTITAIDPAVYQITEYPIDYHEYYFDLEKVHTRFSPDFYTYSSLYLGSTPILVLHRERCGYIVISHFSLLENVSANSKLIYETLMHIYLQDYRQYRSPECWITKQLVDATQLNNKIFNRYHEELPMNKMLSSDDCVIDAYSLIEVTTNSDNIIFAGVHTDKTDMYLNFSKVKRLNEPLKNTDDIFYLSNKKTVFKYTHVTVKQIETGIKISATKTDTHDYLTISSCISSAYKIYRTQIENMLLPSSSHFYYLYHKDNVFSLAEEKLEDDHMLIAEITKKVKTKVKNMDIRLLGGGLPTKYANDYDFIDIGHPIGKPYRLGSTLIITLPKRLEIHRALIEKEVYKHTIAGELVVFVFKD